MPRRLKWRDTPSLLILHPLPVSSMATLFVQASKLEQQMAGRANAEQGLKDQLQACTERHQMLEATITKLEYEVAKAKDVARSTLEEMELTRGKDQSSIRLLEVRARRIREMCGQSGSSRGTREAERGTGERERHNVEGGRRDGENGEAGGRR